MGRLPPQLEHLIAIELRLKEAKIEMESLRDKVAEAERRLEAQAPLSPRHAEVRVLPAHPLQNHARWPEWLHEI